MKGDVGSETAYPCSSMIATLAHGNNRKARGSRRRAQVTRQRLQVAGFYNSSKKQAKARISSCNLA
jgi:hypothetical protein